MHTYKTIFYKDGWHDCYSENQMKRIVLLLCFLFIFIEFILPQTIKKVDEAQCYSEHIKWNIKEKSFKDTVIQFRNYIDNLNDKRIICYDQIQNKVIEKIIWECPYIETYLKYQKKLKKFSFIFYRMDRQKQMIASFYLCDWVTKEAIEMGRFKIEKNQIVGINILPCCQDVFVPIDEFDNPKDIREM